MGLSTCSSSHFRSFWDYLQHSLSGRRPLLHRKTALVLRRGPAAHPSEPDFTNAANKWQLTAVDLESQVDTVNPTLREQRDAYWKAPFGTHRDEKKAAEAAGGAMFTSSGAYLADGPEFSAVKGATWVIATFENFHVYAIEHDYELIYTEMNFRVEQIFTQSQGLSLSNGALVDAAFPGDE
jgi:hypothetical protein